MGRGEKSESGEREELTVEDTEEGGLNGNLACSAGGWNFKDAQKCFMGCRRILKI
jgi:hypothetical protein